MSRLMALVRSGPLRIGHRVPSVVLVVALLAGNAQDPAKPSQELHPSWDPGGSRLVFQSDRYGQPDLFVLDLGTDRVTRLTDSPAVDGSPVWSPTGEWIAFHSNREGNYDLYAIHPDGTGLRRLTTDSLDEMDAGWNPDGTKLVFSIRAQPRHWILGVVSMNGPAVRRLLDEPGDHLTPTWMATGRIAFTYSPPGGNHDTDIVLKTIDENGNGLAELLGGKRGNSNVHYSAAARRLAFNSIRDGNWEIYTSALPDGDERRLTTQALPDNAGIDGQPEWDPAGRRLAITSGRAGSFDIILLDADGRELRNLTATWRSETAGPSNQDQPIRPPAGSALR